MEQQANAGAAGLTIKSLPALGKRVPGVAGKYYGVMTGKDGALYALVLLDATTADTLNWKSAMGWAKEQGGDLPTRPEAAHLFQVARGEFVAEWHWTNETHEADASSAWTCYFGFGYQGHDHKSSAERCRAVRRLPLGSFDPLDGAAKATAERVDELRCAAQQLLAVCDEVGASL